MVEVLEQETQPGPCQWVWVRAGVGSGPRDGGAAVYLAGVWGRRDEGHVATGNFQVLTNQLKLGFFSVGVKITGGVTQRQEQEAGWCDVNKQGSAPASAASWLCDLGGLLHPLWASVSPAVW